MSLPHVYTLSATSGSAGNLSLTADGLAPMSVDAPANFGGPGDKYSPEDLQVAAVASCFILSFRAIANASKLDWQNLEVEVSGTLDKVGRGMAFTGFTTSARLVVADAASVEKGEKLLHKAEQNCLITNSLTADNTLEVTVTASDQAG